LQELEEGPWSQANVDAGSSKIIPVPHPLGGAIVLGESVLSYFNTQHATRSTQIKPNTSIQVRGCCCMCAQGQHALAHYNAYQWVWSGSTALVMIVVLMVLY
jgi:hypothetical protein